MLKIFVADSQKQDAERLRRLLESEGAQVEVCLSGAEAVQKFASGGEPFDLAFILWDVAGPPTGLELLARFRQVAPEMPVVVMGNYLDIDLAASAFPLGARDFLLKPLDAKRVAGCVQTLCSAQQPEAPMVSRLREAIIGESRVLGEMLREVARVIPRADSNVLLIGESGTGKELIVQAIHKFGPRASEPCIPVNVGEVPATLIESALFGHEKGAFTDAKERHVGFLEQARCGTLFLDEIGDLDLPSQGKLLRVIQEKKFRRLRGDKLLPFNARLVCATERDLASAVKKGDFRRAFFHRIADVTVHVPPLREREGDVPILLHHFLERYRGERQVRFARETLAILNRYDFPGNVRELEKLVKEAVIKCDGDQILPRHLNWQNMGALREPTRNDKTANTLPASGETPHTDFAQLEEWLKLPYPEAQRTVIRAFDRIYFRRKLKEQRYVTRAADASGIDPKTFRKHWDEAGLPPLGDKEE